MLGLATSKAPVSRNAANHSNPLLERGAEGPRISEGSTGRSVAFTWSAAALVSGPVVGAFVRRLEICCSKRFTICRTSPKNCWVLFIMMLLGSMSFPYRGPATSPLSGDHGCRIEFFPMINRSITAAASRCAVESSAADAWW